MDPTQLLVFKVRVVYLVLLSSPSVPAVQIWSGLKMFPQTCGQVAIVLSETSTTFILDLPSSCIADDDPDLDTIKKKNAAYLAMKKAKAGQDKYADRAMQTLNGANKNKDAQVDCRFLRDA
eukprot:3935786-Rhodomonas_salina.1